MDRLAELSLLSEEVDGDLLESLSAESRIQILKPQLISEPESRLDLGQELFVARCLCLGVVCQRAELISAFSGLAYSQRHRLTLFDECLGRGVAVVGMEGSF